MRKPRTYEAWDLRLEEGGAWDLRNGMGWTEGGCECWGTGLWAKGRGHGRRRWRARTKLERECRRER